MQSSFSLENDEYGYADEPVFQTRKIAEEMAGVEVSFACWHGIGFLKERTTEI